MHETIRQLTPRTRRGLRPLGAVLAAAVILATATTLPSAAQELPAITIAASTFDSTTSAYYAYKAGLFKKAGLNVNFVPMNPAGILPAIIGGAVQIGNSNLLNVIAGRGRQVPFTIVAPSAMFNDADVPGLEGLIVRSDSPIKSGRDLAGKTIAVPSLNDLNTISAKAWIDKTGGDASAVHFLELPPSSTLASLTAGRVDATILSSPFLQTATDGGALRVVSETYSAISHDFIGLGWITTTDFAAKNPQIIERFARVMREAAIYCNAHQSETASMMAELAQQSPEIAHRMKRVLFAEYLTVAGIQPLIDVAAKYKLIDAPFSAQDLINPLALKAPQR